MFRELDFTGQARSITATINNLQAAIEYHVEHSPRRLETLGTCLAQVDRLRQQLQAAYEQQGIQAGHVNETSAVETMPRLRVGSPRLACPEQAADFIMDVAEESP
jgi:hypothetical protein